MGSAWRSRRAIFKNLICYYLMRYKIIAPTIIKVAMIFIMRSIMVVTNATP